MENNNWSQKEIIENWKWAWKIIRELKRERTLRLVKRIHEMKDEMVKNSF